MPENTRHMHLLSKEGYEWYSVLIADENDEYWITRHGTMVPKANFEVVSSDALEQRITDKYRSQYAEAPAED